MLTEYIHYGLLAGLAIALLIAAFTDMRSRKIYNWLTLTIALGAPLFWWSSGMSLWPDIALQIAVGFGAFAVFTAMFSLGWMGGGDVKLLTALALWIAPRLLPDFLLMMALIGGVLTIVVGGWHIARRRKDQIAVPYGFAIAASGLWVLAINYMPTPEQSAQLLG